MIAHNPLHGSGQADFPHPGWDRTQALDRWAAGSCCYRLLIGDLPVPRSAPRSVSYVPPFHPGRRDCPGPVGDSSFPLGVFHDG
jgi:hypothetical protein